MLYDESSYDFNNDNIQKSYSLSKLIEKIDISVKLNISTPVWVTAEISNVKIKALRSGKDYYSIELVELDNNGKNIAKISALIWPDKYNQVVSFEQITGMSFHQNPNLKVRMRADVKVHKEYGLQLTILNIDPNYTLGDIEARKKVIREKLRNEGIFENNRNLPKPITFSNVVVISPSNAAGLGDFRASANILEKLGFCSFKYIHATFQGNQTSKSISESFDKAIQLKPNVIVLIRGGGASTDLNWLNDELLARKICLCPFPVFTGIGHEKDKTIVDEFSNKYFGTPSKVIEYLLSHIISMGETSAKHWSYIKEYISREVVQNKSALDGLFLDINSHTNERLLLSISKTEDYFESAMHSLQQSLKHCQQNVKIFLKTIQSNLINDIRLIKKDCKNNYQTIYYKVIYTTKYLFNDIVKQAKVNLNQNNTFIDETYCNTHSLIYKNISIFKDNVSTQHKYVIDDIRNKIYPIKKDLAHFSRAICDQSHLTLKLTKHDLNLIMHEVITTSKSNIKIIKEKIDTLFTLIETNSSVKILRRGFSIVRRDGKVITSALSLQNDIVDIIFHDGIVKAQILNLGEMK